MSKTKNDERINHAILREVVVALQEFLSTKPNTYLSGKLRDIRSKYKFIQSKYNCPCYAIAKKLHDSDTPTAIGCENCECYTWERSGYYRKCLSRAATIYLDLDDEYIGLLTITKDIKERRMWNTFGHLLNDEERSQRLNLAYEIGFRESWELFMKLLYLAKDCTQARTEQQKRYYKRLRKTHL